MGKRKRLDRRVEMLKQQALGKNNDALAFAVLAGKPGMDTLDDIRSLDLSRVTAVTRTRDGALSLALADRLTALNALRDIEQQNNPKSLYAAIMASVRHPPTEEDDEPEE